MDGKDPRDELKAKAVEESAGRGPKAPEAPTPVPTGPSTIHQEKNGKYTARRLTPEEVRALMPYYVELGEKPPLLNLIARARWNVRLFRERRKLRKQLKNDFGMKPKPKEFEEIARSVGLGLDKSPAFLFWWFWSWLFGGGGILWLLGLAVLMLCGFFAWSSISEYAGSFTVQINYNTMQSGFVLSETEDFAVKTGRLISQELEKINAVTVGDLPKDVYLGDGVKNGKNYVAYSFYIRNDGDAPDGYEYVLHMKDSFRNAEQAIWCMLFEDDRQVIYAMPSADGDPERLSGYIRTPPFYEEAYDKEYQYYRKEDGKWGIQTTPCESKEVVARGYVRDVQPGEAHRYTVVLWVEGYDPECTDDIFDGYAKYYMEFNPIDEKQVSLFSNLYRTPFTVTSGSMAKSSGFR